MCRRDKEYSGRVAEDLNPARRAMCRCEEEYSGRVAEDLNPARRECAAAKKKIPAGLRKTLTRLGENVPMRR